jgi:hypothetical protein
MHRRMLGTVYYPVPSGVWVIVETLVLRSLRLGLIGPTSQQGYISGIVLDRDILVSLPWSEHGLVMFHRDDVARWY